jgi:hypothetical protein
MANRPAPALTLAGGDRADPSTDVKLRLVITRSVVVADHVVGDPVLAPRSRLGSWNDEVR